LVDLKQTMRAQSLGPMVRVMADIHYITSFFNSTQIYNTHNSLLLQYNMHVKLQLLKMVMPVC